MLLINLFKICHFLLISTQLIFVLLPHHFEIFLQIDNFRLISFELTRNFNHLSFSICVCLAKILNHLTKFGFFSFSPFESIFKTELLCKQIVVLSILLLNKVFYHFLIATYSSLALDSPLNLTPFQGSNFFFKIGELNLR